MRPARPLARATALAARAGAVLALCAGLLLVLAATLWLALPWRPAMGPGHAQILALHEGTLLDLANGRVRSIHALPERAILQPRHDRHFRLVLRMQVQNPADALLWALYFQTLNDGGQVSVNGTVVGEVPSATPARAVLHVRPFLFVVDPRLLRAGSNEIALQWSTHDTLQHLAPVFFGPVEALRPAYEHRLFWQNTMAQAGFDFALVSASLLLGMHAMRRQERRYLLMGLTSLGWAVVCMAFFLPAMPAWLYPYWHLLRLSGIAATACCTWLFLVEEAAPGSRRFARLCIAWAAIGPLGHLLHFWWRDAIYAAGFETVWGMVLLSLGLVPVALLARTLARSWDWRRAVFLLAALAGMLAGVADVSLAGTGSSVLGNTGYAAQATSPLWFSAIVLVLVGDFARFLAQQRRQNALLSQRLREQQVELQRLHEQARAREREQATLQERHRIMQDMHDGLGSQLVSSLALSERGALDAAQTSALLRDCIDDLRLAIDSLAAEQDSLAMMLGNLRFRMAPRLRAAGVALQWHSAGLHSGCEVTPAKALPLLRILQECLGNALKHARAKRIEVRVEATAAQLHLCVADDGCGFDPASVNHGKGLPGLQKRANAIGAVLQVHSQPGAGTRIGLWLPCAPQAGQVQEQAPAPTAPSSDPGPGPGPGWGQATSPISGVGDAVEK